MSDSVMGFLSLDHRDRNLDHPEYALDFKTFSGHASQMSREIWLLEEHYRECAKTLLGICYRNGSKHVSSALSCLELLVHCFFLKMDPADQLILSKGHAAAALYSVLFHKGLLSARELETFERDGTRLPSHPGAQAPDRLVPGIPFGTGSLGHGLSLAAGMALGKKWDGSGEQIFCLISDGECQSGSTWEAALFSSHHQLSNLNVLVDANGLQAFGATEQVLSVEPLVEKWRSFGFLVEVAEDGNGFESIQAASQRLAESRQREARPRPSCLIARTKKGGLVSFMRDRLQWHYLPLGEDDYRVALEEVSRSNAK